jgi:prephenate dehydrogenase
VADVLVLGCGLIGTSIGLALRQAGQDVLLSDSSPESAAVAASRGAGRLWEKGESAGLVVAAVPPAVTGKTLVAAQRADLGQTYTHVASVQSLVQADLESLSSDLSQVVGGHPLAGRELSGPAAAEASLFVGRPWAVCASSSSSPQAVSAVHALAQACGAVPVDVPIEVHDASVARLSHLPQVAASALAGLLAAQNASAAVRFELSGPGLVDSTRLAAGDPELWTQILSANAGHVAGPVRALGERLSGLADELERAQAGDPGAVAALTAFLEEGRRGRDLVPLKRGRASIDFSTVRVDVDDQPGRLAALLTSAGAAGINVEDVHVEHVPGRPRGLIELLVRAEAAQALATALAESGWAVQEQLPPTAG